jgi:hypothetical protein
MFSTGQIPYRVSHNSGSEARIATAGPSAALRNLCTVRNLRKITAAVKIFAILLLTRGVVFGNILDCCRIAVASPAIALAWAASCGGGRLHFGRCLSRGGHVGSSRPDADFPFGLFATGG